MASLRLQAQGVACECEEQAGMHVQEDFFYPEIIDPVTGEQLPDGEEGELVFTWSAKRPCLLSVTAPGILLP